MAFATVTGVNKVSNFANEDQSVEEEGAMDNHVLKSRLINLLLDWELEALSLDARRYRSEAADERESLRRSATLYRKCIADLSTLLGSGSLPKKFKENSQL
jgi:hypothetical protein